MITQEQIRDIEGATAYDRSGDKLGKVGGVYYDDQTDQPKWVTVHTGLFGLNETFVPVHDAEISGDRVTVAYDKAQVKDAPNISGDGHLSPQEEEQLYRYYGLNYDEGYAGGDVTTGRQGFAGDVTTGGGRHAEGFATDTRTTAEAGRGRAADTGFDRDRDGDGVRDDVTSRSAVGRDDVTDRGTVGRDTSGPTTDDAMTRSEERLNVGTETQEAGRARLRKRVVTEHQQVSVPVSHEEVTLDREPITEANRGEAYDGAAISEEEHEVTLHAERPVVDTEAVAVERVRLGKETVTDHETVGGEVRKEEIELDKGDVRGRRDDDRL